MDFRNPTYNAAGGIDLEIEHPTLGWIPFTASLTDLEELGRSMYVAASSGYVAPYVPPAPPSPTLEDYRLAVQQRIDALAQVRRYDNGTSLAGYALSTNPTWRAEAEAFVSWRDAVWTHVYQALDDVTNGDRPQPTVAELLSELPPIDWP